MPILSVQRFANGQSYVAFASLPKVPTGQLLLVPDEIHGLRLPPRPYEVSDNYDVEDLDRQFRGVVDETLTMQAPGECRYPLSCSGCMKI